MRITFILSIQTIFFHSLSLSLRVFVLFMSVFNLKRMHYHRAPHHWPEFVFNVATALSTLNLIESMKFVIYFFFFFFCAQRRILERKKPFIFHRLANEGGCKQSIDGVLLSCTHSKLIQKCFIVWELIEVDAQQTGSLQLNYFILNSNFR